MVNKVLFCATVDYHFKLFHLPYLQWFKEQGWEVHVAANGNIDLPYVDEKFDLPIQRSPIHIKNIRAYQELHYLINIHQYKIIHCHTPMGGVLARMAARKARRIGTNVIYTAHGFHFCNGAPLTNWLLYYPAEWLLAKHTDCLITINTEDYQLATRRFRVGDIRHVNGVGVDTDVFKPINAEVKKSLRKSLGYQPNDFLLFYAAEFNKNKNQQMLLHALAMLKDQTPKLKLLLAGEGSNQFKCQQLAKRLGISHMVDFLGYRNDINQILPLCDVAVGSSLREGLPVNVMEAMACGLPIVATENRGHKELVTNHLNGFTVRFDQHEQFAQHLLSIYQSKELYLQLREGSLLKTKDYSLQAVKESLQQIYFSYMTEEVNETKSKYHRAYL